MLMHHTDADRDGLFRGADTDFSTVNVDGATIGFVKTVQNRHQGRFTRAVFADDSVHGAACDGEVHVFVGANLTEAFIDVRQGNGGSVSRHCMC